MSHINRHQIAERFRLLQDDICRQLEAADGSGRFQEDPWTRPEGGGGRSRVIEGAVIEKGGVMFSEVFGPLPEITAKAMSLPPTDFFATGVSIVLHPCSPMAPIIHMNVRYFETGTGRWWFGGGIDLTPHYVVPDDARYFHQQLKAVCDRFHPQFYADFKAQADDYFFLRHRQETRGVGGIFFDYLDDQSGLSQPQLCDFAVAVGDTFAPTYAELLRRAAPRPFGQEQQAWQALRRGRYVEFNLVWDRGTKFGLETNGRTESILVSMPPAAAWRYGHQPAAGSPEAETLAWLRKGIEWLPN
ncbi:MAG TPA: oxygen-dependent coproporphyrinogen oxidase [Saprospiraceae bacterium]|nr:oxygen-dependent coproporphyrinogen oxidase [Saprospiraceae bacterium]HND89716.1 oxygen-dependent coproporphyrinogen oxidase [Saprospiraceae bacterium]